jgi:hypothetical protein
MYNLIVEDFFYACFTVSGMSLKSNGTGPLAYRVHAHRHQETNENRHKRTAQHIGSPRRGVI